MIEHGKVNGYSFKKQFRLNFYLIHFTNKILFILLCANGDERERRWPPYVKESQSTLDVEFVLVQ